MKRPWQALARHWEWLLRREGKRRGEGSIASRKEDGEDRGSWTQDRFWAEFREGQRQAEENCLEAGALTRKEVWPRAT